MRVCGALAHGSSKAIDLVSMLCIGYVAMFMILLKVCFLWLSTHRA